jgi:cytochrome c oxidase accessory protein FixG
VQVCPTGIDIRQGLQYECIGCAACIDGCDQVMDKMGYPKGLIRYTTENALEHKVSEKNLLRRVFRPRVLVYTAILGAIIATAAAAMYMRVPIKVNVLHDRATLSRETDEGKIENVYRLQVMNTDETRRHFTVSVEGATGLEHIEVVGEAQPMEIGPASSRIIPLRVRAKVDQEHRGTTPIRFLIEASDDQQRPRPEIFSVREKSVFIAPR